MYLLQKERMESAFLSVFVSPQRIQPAGHAKKRNSRTPDDE
jgi:hypothetical protein